MRRIPDIKVDYVPGSELVVGVEVLQASANLPEVFKDGPERLTPKLEFPFSRKLTSLRGPEVPLFSTSQEAARFALIDTPPHPTNETKTH